MEKVMGTVCNSTASTVHRVQFAKRRVVSRDPVTEILAYEKEPPTDEDGVYKWPASVEASFVITMDQKRPERYAAMQQRLGPWSSHVTKWPAVDGSLLNRRELVIKGELDTHSTLKRGEIGCFMSHVSIWQHMVDKGIRRAFIFEDDANIVYSRSAAQCMHSTLDEADEKHPGWGVLYFGKTNVLPSQRFGKYLGRRVIPCFGLYAYVITLEVAQYMLERCWPITEAIDMLLMRTLQNDGVPWFFAHPRLCHVVSVVSDTQGIA